MPFSPATRVERGDVMTLVGATRDVERAAKELGYADRQTVMTDMIFVGLGIVLGGFMGLLTLTVAGLPLTLTASGGALIMGLVFGWLRAVHPTFGRIPGSAMWIFDTVGLTVFMACVGLAAGPSFFSGLQKSGISLVFVGLVIAILPHAVSILFGRYVLRMNPVIVLGACCGAGTITAALRAVQEEADSDLPALGLHRALRDWQYRAHGMGASLGRHDDVGGAVPAWGGALGNSSGTVRTDDLSLCVFSAPSSWLCIRSFVGAAPI